MFNSYSKILVTGSSGFIGGRLIKALCEKKNPNQTVVGISRKYTSNPVTYLGQNLDVKCVGMHCNLANFTDCKNLFDRYSTFFGIFDRTRTHPPTFLFRQSCCY